MGNYGSEWFSVFHRFWGRYCRIRSALYPFLYRNQSNCHDPIHASLWFTVLYCQRKEICHKNGQFWFCRSIDSLFWRCWRNQLLGRLSRTQPHWEDKLNHRTSLEHRKIDSYWSTRRRITFPLFRRRISETQIQNEDRRGVASSILDHRHWNEWDK